MGRIIELELSMTYFNRNMLEVNYKLVHNRSATWCGTNKHRFKIE